MARKVLVVVDVQNDFAKGGVLAYGFPAHDITGDIEKTVKAALDNGDYVFATQDTHYADYYSTLEGQKLPIQHCIIGTHGWEFVPWLKELGGQFFEVDKHSFGSTELCKRIRAQACHDGNEIGEIQLVGFCTSICVLSNAVLLRAHFPNMKISVVSDLCGDIDEESHKAALKVLRNQQIEIK